jgi:hypothetical protein
MWDLGAGAQIQRASVTPLLAARRLGRMRGEEEGRGARGTKPQRGADRESGRRGRGRRGLAVGAGVGLEIGARGASRVVALDELVPSHGRRRCPALPAAQHRWWFEDFRGGLAPFLPTAAGGGGIRPCSIACGRSGGERRVVAGGSTHPHPAPNPQGQQTQPAPTRKSQEPISTRPMQSPS